MNVYALCAVEAGADLILAIGDRIPLAGIIGLSPSAHADGVSGFIDTRAFAERMAVPYHEVLSYSLRRPDDQELIRGLAIDVLLVCGWQRLVPEWVIDHCRTAVLGLHGAPGGITVGRGRSPQNWSLILGTPSFDLALFLIEKGVDDGAVIATRSFTYAPTDDIVSSYAMCTLLAADMIVATLSGDGLRAGPGEQQDEHARYFPQRLPEDGAIDWDRSPVEVSRFVAALTRPYPGATTRLRGRELMVWRARPLSIDLAPTAPGQVVLVLTGGRLVVATRSGLVLVDEYEVRGQAGVPPAVGDILESVSFPEQMRKIVSRHHSRHPDQTLREDILAACAKRDAR